MARSVLVAGAGIAGLAAALALARRGCAVEIREQADALGEVGAGLQLSPNAMKVLRALDLEDRVLQTGFEPLAAVVRHYRTGRRHIDLPLNPVCRSRYGAPYLHIHRADLHAILADAARAAGVTVRLGTTVAGYGAADHGIRVDAVPGATAEPDLLIGADGVRSVVAAHMLGSTHPRFTGQVAWRATVPVARVPEGAVEPNATVWAGPGRHVVTYWLRGGTLANVVAVQEREDWRDETWTMPGNPDELRAAFAGWHSSVTDLLAAVEQTLLWALFDRPTLPRWHDGRAVLIGDACHPTLPFMAQGAAMALEDALILARLVTGTDDLADALDRFEALRKPRTSRLQARARQNAGLFHLTEGPAGLVSRAKLAMAPLLPAAIAMRQFDWIYGYDATSI